MSSTDHAASIEPTLRPLLGVRERLLAVGPVAEDAEAGELAALLAGSRPAAALWSGAVQCPTGVTGGVARQLVRRIGGVPSAQFAVTDQRLLIFTTEDVAQHHAGWHRWFSPAELVARQVHTVPREAVLGAVQLPGGRQHRTRLVIGFVDGTGCVLAGAPTGLVESLVRAISG